MLVGVVCKGSVVLFESKEGKSGHLGFMKVSLGSLSLLFFVLSLLNHPLTRRSFLFSPGILPPSPIQNSDFPLVHSLHLLRSFFALGLLSFLTGQHSSSRDERSLRIRLLRSTKSQRIPLALPQLLRSQRLSRPSWIQSSRRSRMARRKQHDGERFERAFDPRRFSTSFFDGSVAEEDVGGCEGKGEDEECELEFEVGWSCRRRCWEERTGGVDGEGFGDLGSSGWGVRREGFLCDYEGMREWSLVGEFWFCPLVRSIVSRSRFERRV